MILRDILVTLDKLQVYNRTEGKLPCVLLDGHGSRFRLPFLNYMSNPLHEWCAVIGVPYGTVLWQVDDSPEQNRSHNTASSKEKRFTVEEKEKYFIAPTIKPWGLFLLYQQRGKSCLQELKLTKTPYPRESGFRTTEICSCILA